MKMLLFSMMKIGKNESIFNSYENIECYYVVAKITIV